MGNTDNADGEVYQEVRLPQGAAPVTLSFWWHMSTTEVTHPYDRLFVELWDASGMAPVSIMQDLVVITDGDIQDTWTRAAVNIDDRVNLDPSRIPGPGPR
jgi:hypothetical protein